MLNMLIVDDSDIEREGIRFLLDKHGLPLQLFEACDGNEALAILKRQHIDILFTDIKMPHMDGIQLASNARTLYPDLYIIFCSAYGEFEYARVAVSLHASSYLLRPVREETFVSAISSVIRQCEHEKQVMDNIVEIFEEQNNKYGEPREALAELLDMSHVRRKDVNRENSLSDKVREIVQKRYAQDISVDDIASEMHLSAGHLCRSFKKETGISLMQFVMLYRLERAKELLLKTDKKVADIAIATGFQSASYFGMIFRRELDMTPNAFREEGSREKNTGSDNP